MSWSRYQAVCEFPDRKASRVANERGSSLVEVMISTVILLVGLVGGAQMLAVSIQMHQLSRGSTDATRLAQTKFEELAKLNFVTAAEVQVSPVGPDPLTQNVPNYFDTTAAGDFTRRWSVAAGPVPTTRLLTVRVVPARAGLRLAKPVELVSVIRQW